MTDVLTKRGKLDTQGEHHEKAKAENHKPKEASGGRQTTEARGAA